MLGKLLLLPIIGPIMGVVAVSKKIAEQADKETFDKTRVTRELMELQTQLDLGQISETEYNAREEELLEDLEAIEALNKLDDEEAD